jgi:hypothetical protein
MASPNLSEIVTTTLEKRSKKLADNVTKNNALLSRLESKGNVKPADGGSVILQELEYGENGTFTWYSGYDTLNIAPSDVVSAASFDWKQAAVAVTMSGLEELQNSGQPKLIDLLETRIKNAEKTMKNKMAQAVYGDGTVAAGKSIGGLQLLVSDAAAANPGNINATTWPFWQNRRFDATTDGTAAATTANMLHYMNLMWLSLVRGTDKPDLIVADNAYYTLYWEALLPNQRFTSPQMAQAGFESLRYMGADVVFDGGIGGFCPANHMYFLNTDYIYLRPHTDRQYVPLNPDRYTNNQDAFVKLIGWAGNMTTSGRMFQGVLKD